EPKNPKTEFRTGRRGRTERIHALTSRTSCSIGCPPFPSEKLRGRTRNFLVAARCNPTNVDGVAIPMLKLRANAKPRVLAGHPWVFVNEIEALLPPEHDGEVVECRDRTGRYIGTGIYNSKSQIVWR